ncbi:hypothetical protein, partial [uncultured Shewanella sp.]|uniref:hypothetical protein n=1 Tax=uncultured Shewanella sp. TaxID=173975 RepID=UPI00262588FC
MIPETRLELAHALYSKSARDFTSLVPTDPTTRAKPFVFLESEFKLYTEYFIQCLIQQDAVGSRHLGVLTFYLSL